MELIKSYSKVGEHFSSLEKRILQRWTIMIPGAGCEYYKNTNGGCTMCGFYKANKKYSFGWLYPALVFKSLYLAARKNTEYLQPKELFLYNGGSFFNPREIPQNFADYLFKAVKEHPTLKRIMVESRIEYLEPEKIHSALRLLNGKKLMIGIGLESSDDKIRNQFIKKGLDLDKFKNTVAMLKEFGVQILAYVFLKPLGLSDKEAVKDAWRTIKFCHVLGIDEIEISCAFIQPNTKMAEAYYRQEFLPPSLWSITELIRRAEAEKWKISIGGFGDEPPPIAIPRNDCPDDCSSQIYPLIEEYRHTGKFDFSKLPNCSCRLVNIF